MSAQYNYAIQLQIDCSPLTGQGCSITLDFTVHGRNSEQRVDTATLYYYRIYLDKKEPGELLSGHWQSDSVSAQLLLLAVHLLH